MGAIGCATGRIGNSFLAMLPAWHGHLAWQQFLAGA
jgi:hypothetical protein